MTGLVDDTQALLNQVAAIQSQGAANATIIATLQAQIAALQSGTAPAPNPAPSSSGWPITPQRFDPLAGSAGHDSTAAIASAIAACPSGGKVVIPATVSGYTISNGFTITKPISIVGDGMGTLFVGALPAGVDLFHVVVPANGILRGFSFSCFQVALTAGGHLIHLDTTAANANMAEVNVSNVFAAIPAGYNGIFIDNAASNPNGGTFDANFERNFFAVQGASGACIYIANGGDSIHIHGGILTGTGYAIYSNQIAFAGNLIVDGAINLTATGGIRIDRGVKPVIRDFEMEFGSALLTGAGVNFAGAVGPIVGGTIGPGQIQAFGAAAGSFGEAIYINNASDVGIDGMQLSSGIGGTGINITGSAARTRLGAANAYSGFTTNVLNASGTTHTIP